MKPDSIDYLSNADAPLNLAFFTFPKPAGLAFLYKILGNNLQDIVAFQVVISIITWLVLAFALVMLLRSIPLKRVAFPSVLLLSFAGDIVEQNSIILSESLSSSLFILSIALILFMLKRPSPAGILSFILIACGWGLVKESNGLILGITSIVFGSFGVSVKKKAYFLLIGIVLFSSFMMI